MKKSFLLLVVLCLLVSAMAVSADDAKHTVTYVENNCLAVVPVDNNEYGYAEKVNVLFEPVQYKDGLIFYGWDWNEDGIADFGYNYNTFNMPNKDVTLKAICLGGGYGNPGPAYPAPAHPGPAYPAPAKPAPHCTYGCDWGWGWNWSWDWGGYDWYPVHQFSRSHFYRF